MSAIPRSALLLGLAGLLPFIAAAVLSLGTTLWLDILALPLVAEAGRIALHYGVVILAFMSGVLWGFATRADGATATRGYGLSVIPALWAFFTTLGDQSLGLLALIVGFIALLTLDHWFWRQSLAPVWWMRLRLLLTAIVVACLMVVLFS